ncbi:MAG: hypothetical protein PVJ68_06835 [Candidatus Thiodiazotropha sp.]
MPVVVTKPLGIALLGVNERDRARMELFIDHHWSSNCLLVAEEYADLCILDIDGPEGKKLLKQLQDCHAEIPLIVLSVHDTDINDALHLRKPLSGDLLKSTIDDHMTALLHQSPTEKVPAFMPEPEPIPKKRSESRRELNPSSVKPKKNTRRAWLPNAVTQARIIRGSCGLSDSIKLRNLSRSNKLYYDPSKHFQQVLKSAIEQCRAKARPLRVNLPDEKYILLLPETNIALTNLSDSKLRPRCLMSIGSHQIHIDYPSDYESDSIQADTQTPQDIDSLLWKVTLWSARGRLPLGTDIDTTIVLRQWPNLTRLMAFPHFLRIAALWVKTPLSLNKTTELLNIEARYVCAFFSACYALELIQFLSTTEDAAALDSNQKESVAPKGLLRRILRRLRVA